MAHSHMHGVHVRGVGPTGDHPAGDAGEPNELILHNLQHGAPYQEKQDGGTVWRSTQRAYMHQVVLQHESYKGGCAESVEGPGS